MHKPSNVLVAQSGGPTPVINSSLRGVIETCSAMPDRFGTVYAGFHGIEGVLREELLDLSAQPADEIALLSTTPAAGSIGTCRYKLKSDQQEDFERVIEVAQSVGFVHQNVADVDLFLDGPEGSVRSAIHIVFAREKVRPDYPLPAPDVTESVAGPEFTVAALEALVRMKLTSFRLKDKVHLLDLLDVGLIDESWCDRFPPELGSRLRELIESKDREV